MIDLPSAKFDKGLLRRMGKLGCVINLQAYDSDNGEFETCRSAIGMTFMAKADSTILSSIEPRKLRERKFFGDWLDFDTGKLILRGSHRNDAGEELMNPTLFKLAKFNARIASGGVPAVGEGGQFAYAFLCPPYSLRGRAEAIQETFDELRASVLPNDSENEILDWTSPLLADFSPYFKVGMDWWGIFLFTIFNQTRGRLIVLSASTTD